jgi:hypothetical protein
MNRREANRHAKQIFMDYGKSGRRMFNDVQRRHGWTNKETALVQDYYCRCANRVEEWLDV